MSDLPTFDYSMADASQLINQPLTQPATKTTTYTLLKLGSSGDSVKKLQEQLISLGYPISSATGYYGTQTQAAVLKYQKDMGLTADGLAGTQTQTSLYSQTPKTTTTATAPTTTTTTAPKTTTTTAPSHDTSDPNLPSMDTSSQNLTGTAVKAPMPGADPNMPSMEYADPLQAKPPITQGQTAPTATAPKPVASTTTTQPQLGSDPNLPSMQYADPLQAKPPLQPGQTQPTHQTPVITAQPDTPPVVQPAAKPAAQTQIQTGSTGSTGTTAAGTGTQLQPTVGTGIGTDTGAGTGSGVGGYTGGSLIVGGEFEDYQPEENPYIQRMTEMKFDYDPFSDNAYLRAAEQTENQIVQMMLGRGGLYSSVARDAITLSLLNLQSDFVTQAYKSFIDERDFMFEMAKYFSDEQSKVFSQRMQIAQYGLSLSRFNLDVEKFNFDQQKEAFNQQLRIAEFEFDQYQEAFKQQAWVAEFNFKQQQAAFDQWAKQQSLSISRANAQFKVDQANLEMEMAQQRSFLLAEMQNYEGKFTDVAKALQMLEADGYAKQKFVQDTLGLQWYDTATTGADRIDKVVTGLEQWHQSLLYNAAVYSMDKQIMSSLNNFNPDYVATKPQTMTIRETTTDPATGREITTTREVPANYTNYGNYDTDVKPIVEGAVAKIYWDAQQTSSAAGSIPTPTSSGGSAYVAPFSGTAPLPSRTSSTVPSTYTNPTPRTTPTLSR